MKWMFLLALVAIFGVQVDSAPSCDELKKTGNCDKCDNPAPQCYDCPAGSKLSEKDKASCVSCGSYCAMCDLNPADVVTCTECTPAAYQKPDKSCEKCPNGCKKCQIDSGNVVKCDSVEKCIEGYEFYDQDSLCKDCGTGCKKCSLNTDGSLKECTECYGGSDKVDGYYLKEGSCSKCPSNCVECTYDTAGKFAKCSACKTNYKVLTTEGDSNKDKKCLECPKEAVTCSNNEKSGKAEATKCKDGYRVNSGKCEECSVSHTGCDKCNDNGDCTVCDDGYRLDGTTCAKCDETKCKNCDTQQDTCDVCEEKYNLKKTTSKTCDACTSNCATCSRGSDGKFSCSQCATGYYKTGSGTSAKKKKVPTATLR